MAGWLARLKSRTNPDTHATKPTKPGSVGFVACLPAPFQKSEGNGTLALADMNGKVTARLHQGAANDPAEPDPDRWCWPHIPAMNAGEIDAFTARLARFTDKGVSMDEAEALADKLVSRDRELDDRRLCLECAHLHGAGRWRCRNAERAEVSESGLASGLVLMLQRCPGFKEVRP